MKLRLAIAAAALAALWLITPPYVPSCPFRWLTGLPCPLCGITRALFLLAKGEWREAVALHALSPLIAGAGLALVVCGQRRLARVWGWVGGAVLAYGIARILNLTHTL